MDTIIPANQAGGALKVNAEHYQTFEMAKSYDDVLAGESVAEIRNYCTKLRAGAQLVHSQIALMDNVDDVIASKAELLESEQALAKVAIFGDQRIGELLRKLPTKAGQRNDLTSSDVQEEVTKADALEEAGIGKSQAYDLEKLAANPEVVQAVIDKATEEGRVVSRKQVLDAIKERDAAIYDAKVVRRVGETLKQKVDELKQQVAQQAEPEVVEVVREVVPEDYEEMQKRVKSLEHEVKVTNETYQRMRKNLNETRQELYKARDILGMSEQVHEVRRDVQYLITATNGYVRQYGGLTWTAQSLATVDEPTREELTKAVRNLSTFANTLMNFLEGINE